MAQKTILIWGAGKIGRGFIADLFHAAGYRIILVDESRTLITQLCEADCYTVVWAENAERRQDVVVERYTALSTAQADQIAAAVVAADILAVAVYPQHFAQVARQLAPGVVSRQARRPSAPLNIVLCTNLAHAGPQFRALLQAALPPESREYMNSHIGIVETLVIRIVTEPPGQLRRREPLLVWTNGYPELPVDRHAFKGEIPQVSGLRLVNDMRAEETRKLYTYNMFQAALAYLGAFHGYKLVVECMADPEVCAGAAGALHEVSCALQTEYGFTSDEMACWIDNVVTQTNNPTLGDTVRRLGADPRRKLKREDRLIGPALLARKHGVQPGHLVRAIAAGLRYDDPDDPGVTYIQQRIATLGLPEAVREICGLTEAELDLIEAITQAYQRLALEEKGTNAAQQAYELGFKYEKVYHGCGQCTLAAVLETLGRFSEPVFEAATGLSGGIGLAGDATCSALTGAVLAFGTIYPRRREEFDADRENKYRTFAMAQRLRERYLQRYGTINCHEIHRHQLGRAFDLRDSTEREAFEAAGAHEDKCTHVVAQAARWAVEIINDELIEDALIAPHSTM
ncbi:MAG: C-GCAxxG-C-C family (seleno)protein [Anaerolineae bacterium]